MNDTCPSCKSDQIEGGTLEWEGPTIRQRMHCLACDQAWIDIYKFDGRDDDN